MILFMILLIMGLISLGIVITVVGALGAGFLAIFGDVIVCLFIVGFIIKKIFFNKKK